MRVIELEEVREIHNKVGFVEGVDPISPKTSSCLPLSANKYANGSIVEMIKYTYSQGLHKYIYCLYERIEVA